MVESVVGSVIGLSSDDTSIASVDTVLTNDVETLSGVVASVIVLAIGVASLASVVASAIVLASVVASSKAEVICGTGFGILNGRPMVFSVQKIP